MSVRCAIGNVEAVIANDHWECDDPSVLLLLLRLGEREFPIWSPSDGDPDYREAEYCMHRLGGRIVRYDELLPDGVIY